MLNGKQKKKYSRRIYCTNDTLLSVYVNMFPPFMHLLLPIRILSRLKVKSNLNIDALCYLCYFLLGN